MLMHTCLHFESSNQKILELNLLSHGKSNVIKYGKNCLHADGDEADA